jgi:hypothetical protein
MKNTIKLIIALVAVIGLGMVSCDNGSTGGSGDALTGTWEAPAGSFGNSSIPYLVGGTDGTWVMYEGDSVNFEIAPVPMGKGTYTLDGTTVNLTITHLYNDGAWADYNGPPTPNPNNLPPKNLTGTISGSTFTLAFGGESVVFTKVGGGGEGGGGGTPSIIGTWVGTEETFVFNNDGTFKMIADGSDMFAGTYSASADTITVNITAINGAMFGGLGGGGLELEDRLYTKEDFLDYFQDMLDQLTDMLNIIGEEDPGYAELVEALENFQAFIAWFEEILDEAFDEMSGSSIPYSISGNMLTLTMEGEEGEEGEEEEHTYTKQQ